MHSRELSYGAWLNCYATHNYYHTSHSYYMLRARPVQRMHGYFLRVCLRRVWRRLEKPIPIGCGKLYQQGGIHVELDHWQPRSRWGCQYLEPAVRWVIDSDAEFAGLTPALWKDSASHSDPTGDDPRDVAIETGDK